MVTYIGGYMDELDKSSGMFFSVKNWSDCKDVLERELSRFVFGNIKCELFDDFFKNNHNVWHYRVLQILRRRYYRVYAFGLFN